MLNLLPSLQIFPNLLCRPESAERFVNEIRYECAVFPEDILRRREAFRIYREDLGKSEEKAVNSAFREIKK